MAALDVVQAKMQLMFSKPGADVEYAEQLYHDDAVLEFPQSGERFEGRENFTEWRSRYPAGVEFNITQVTYRDDLAVSEAEVRYDGGEIWYGVGIHEFRGDRIARERIYASQGWDAPEWRAQWRAAPPTGAAT